jgi:septum formation protein
MTPKRLVLASASPRRSQLLSQAGFIFDVIPADADETLPDGLPPAEAAIEVSRRKALAIAGGMRSAVILAADTIVVAPGGKILGKPGDESDARRMLRELSGSTHVVITGVFAIDCDTARTVGCAVATTVVFGKMTDAEIDAYVASGEALGKAGAYAIQETGDRFVRRVEGSFTNIVGLPMEKVAEILTGFGITQVPAWRGATGEYR